MHRHITTVVKIGYPDYLTKEVEGMIKNLNVLTKDEITVEVVKADTCLSCGASGVAIPIEGGDGWPRCPSCGTL